MVGPAPLVLGPDYPARKDRQTHIERICPNPNGESPAWLPRAAKWHAPASRPDLEPVGIEALSDEAKTELVEILEEVGREEEIEILAPALDMEPPPENKKNKGKS